MSIGVKYLLLRRDGINSEGAEIQIRRAMKDRQKIHF